MSVPAELRFPRWNTAIALSLQKKEGMRHRIIQLVFIIYWLLIFEGALRKWVVPQLNELIFFIRVPFVFIVYWLAFKHKLWPKPRQPLLISYGLAFAATVLIPLQFIAGGYSTRYLMLAGYGWFNYFLYIPLAFLIAEQFDREDLNRLIRHTLWIAILSAPLVILQFNSPSSAVVNLGSAEDETNQFKNLGAALGYVRPTGFFTSTAGQKNLVASAAAIALAIWLLPARARPVEQRLLVAGTSAVITMLAMSGSRGLFLSAGLILVSATVAGVLARRKKIIVRAGVWPAFLVVVVGSLWPVVFPDAYEVFMERWTGAWASESQIFEYGIFSRAFHGFYAFVQHMDDTPLLGYLIGMRGNAAAQLNWVRLPEAAYQWTGYGGWGEDGWSRHIIELGPIVGFLFIFYRIGLVIWLARRVIKSTRQSGDPLAMLLFGSVGLMLLNGQITGHGTHNGYAWLFLGFCLAATKTKET